MRILAISGSARLNSTNTAMLRAIRAIAPSDIELSIFDGVGRLPVFSPDLEGEWLPEVVRDFIDVIAQSDGVIFTSPEYVRSIPGGLKNAIDWLVSGDEIVHKPIALLHASHRGDDMLAGLRTVLATITDRFAGDIFLRLPLMKLEPAEVFKAVEAAENHSRVQAYLQAFSAYCMADSKTA
ncbi:NADPH-dependent FMN reductase [Rhizobium ruizarguesonis]|jgi:NAD(P)H-dependent FMN reductase|uniref:NADPH-dependent FMN reductase n=1 Tax=Rhizobium ruizarguesonis TaxID=2081791 RepID=UPI001031C43B|nr:NADPH-dependent FMN reductase [Rhizobium ruizarguesonis]MBY5853568.1 NAD(P)H-dependent oxidoreductase [Rhizobium leguminosarum]MBY5889341.1 NAD(P)H-dependent oxidoreductase [Rhizobium leguminosarum]QSY99204.1 NAD(P)H-dependent oxidoreductase [Rhizobium ruizarguesonis]TAT79091.1 NAD(P)H-dependent oxidoreductase [Rhizobium ruizarguesonis]TAT89003.1 NAD(P)H-dependent oxidoreductase [Rhizobium ruizarguesonis]